jgi:ABC-2 type transport system ATP-binding protein
MLRLGWRGAEKLSNVVWCPKNTRVSHRFVWTLKGRPMLEARELSKYYGSVPAVQNVTFRLEPGEVLGYLGPNGSGKSTTVKMLTGLLQPSRGEVTQDGEDIHKNLAGYRKRLGYIPEEANLYPYLTGEEYLEMVGTLRSMPEARRKSRIDSLLQLFALGPHRQVSLGSYSKGMRQRILLISALMDNPDVLILDEPMSGLDVTSSLVLKNLIQELSGRGKAIFFCSHVLEVVEKICSQLIILRKGQVIAYGRTAEVLQSIGQSTLEGTFLQLTEGRDVAQIANDIVDVVVA